MSKVGGTEDIVCKQGKGSDKEWVKAYNEKLRNLFSLPNIVLNGCQTSFHT